MTTRVLSWFFFVLSIEIARCFLLVPDLEQLTRNLPNELERLAESVDGRKCREDLKLLSNGIANLDLWALKMLDVNAKWNPGFLLGNIKSLGSYDGCVSIKETNPPIQGKYCLTNVDFSTDNEKIDQLLELATLWRRDREIIKNRTIAPVIPDLLPSMSLIQFGLCVPSSCSAFDVEQAFRALLMRTEFSKGAAQVESCYVNETMALSNGDLTFILCVVFISILVLSSTVIECWFGLKTDGGFCYNSLMAFSLPTNWRKLFTISNSPNALKSLDGIRVLSTLWVVAGHKIIFTLQEPWANKSFQIESLENIVNMPLINNMPSVDSFFLMSGLLRAFNLLKEFEGNRFQFVTDFVRRYLRLTPAYALVIAFYSTLLTRLGNGPRWEKFVTEPGEACAENWLYNLLYVNNYVHNNKHCIMQTWYLASDMQLYLASPLVIYFLWKRPSAGKVLLILLAVVPITFTAWYTYTYEVLPTYLLNNSDMKLISYQKDVHIATQHRMAPYVVGLGLGYVLFNYKTVKLNFLTVILGWMLCLSTLYAVVYGAFNLIQYNHKYDPVESALYASLHRVSWALAVGWLIFACNRGFGGWITKIMSMGVFQLFSKISYCIYLSHYVILMIGAARIKSPIFVDEYVEMHSYAGDLVVITAVATVLYLMVEAPLFEITRLIFATPNKPIKKKEN
ncbi:nose resistant to fluoxetine protein 6-like [Neocloeon triangulifer]|uniref:nose resistant to fluoxetine protein 6-like n=1 Tax=Neocloeon triangulifer TaxID=2078957 RepID=UPI00286F4375|nr:nose resistant to fluoxetine protein 6-like [Neocloeon triangulifer]